jgi:transcriptional repressor NrdR
MVCLYCKSPTSVSNSRHQKSLNQVWRRRQCTECGAIFTTHEVYDHASSLALQTRDGKLQPFKKERLFLSILKTCEHRNNELDDAVAITETVMTKLLRTISSGAVFVDSVVLFTYETLLNFDKASAVRYAALHPGYSYAEK